MASVVIVVMTGLAGVMKMVIKVMRATLGVSLPATAAHMRNERGEKCTLLFLREYKEEQVIFVRRVIESLYLPPKERNTLIFLL